ncbi:MAG TPA: glycosyltransferase family 4 protein [Polyangia bacterium]|nr:glycosyltransferase family 4 protein [Polyangia bacterium]
MRIAQVSPLYESVPPKLYGGTERVVYFLTEALLDLGHEVTLFASGDSRTRAPLVPVAPTALRLNPNCQEQVAPHVRLVEEVMRRADEFDVIHFHVDYFGFSLASRSNVPHVTTQHGRLDIPELEPLFRMFPNEPQVSISNAQRGPLAFANWAGTVYHGLPPDLYRLQPRPGRYLAFLGRVSPEKRVDRAIEIAQQLDMPLKIAAKVASYDQAYFEQTVKPMLGDPRIEFIGEIGEADKQDFLGNAAALLFPVDWPEPFGLVMIEAMACGTPVVAFRRGSVAEVVTDGVSGFVVDSVEEAVAATPRAIELSRAGCRAEFEARFLAERMARDYVTVYESLCEAKRDSLWLRTRRAAGAEIT